MCDAEADVRDMLGCKCFSILVCSVQSLVIVKHSVDFAHYETACHSLPSTKSKTLLEHAVLAWLTCHRVYAFQASKVLNIICAKESNGRVLLYMSW